MRFSSQKCTGCRICQLVCSLRYQGECNPGASYIIIESERPGFRASFTTECNECGLCALRCPYGALQGEDRDG